MNFLNLPKLKELFTPENLAYLNRVLAGLTDPNTPGYHDFWAWFKGGYKDPEAYARAYRVVHQLFKFLKS